MLVIKYYFVKVNTMSVYLKLRHVNVISSMFVTQNMFKIYLIFPFPRNMFFLFNMRDRNLN
jgi:hypothetical protein